jgi:hypothetical protein
MLFIVLPNNKTAGRCEHGGKPCEYRIADGVLSFLAAGSGEEWVRYRIITATVGDEDGLTEYVCAGRSRRPGSILVWLKLHETTIATVTALLQAADRAAEAKASPSEFLELLLEDRAAGTEPQGAILRLVKALAENEARGVATPPVAETFRALALAELVEALAAIQARH